MVADCLPSCSPDSAAALLASAHAGWRGLAAVVTENTVLALDMPPRNLLAYLGPAIGPSAFEVGDEVRDAFVAVDPAAGYAFHPTNRANGWPTCSCLRGSGSHGRRVERIRRRAMYYSGPGALLLPPARQGVGQDGRAGLARELTALDRPAITGSFALT